MENKTSILSLPAAIIIAGAIIAIAIVWINKPETQTKSGNSNIPINSEITVRKIDSTDHILGNPDAQVKIIEYSDASCPACKIFNETMVKVMDDFGPDGKVAWVYRHFPLDKEGTRSDGGILHPNAGMEAQALECAGALGGNDKFWKYEKRLYEITPSVTQTTPGGLDRKQLPEIAKYVGIDTNSFNECLSSGRFKGRVEADYKDALDGGAMGTPYSVIITPSGSMVPLTGSLPYANMKAAIQALLSGTE